MLLLPTQLLTMDLGDGTEVHAPLITHPYKNIKASILLILENQKYFEIIIKLTEIHVALQYCMKISDDPFDFSYYCMILNVSD